ncbi:SipW-dependent-type signal peptide-containing protein [Clostridium aestuarii]|uniref:SipW-dependent-type signal peptide-containing protein n=1 Tax=Clostridium aestuarii TaxID=338193 RepID=A0ABT4CWK2_9CLOT|nr:SipW-dependent-type signal peptide-containing protein [Clostridium aestuarii]MCY6483354.1 SipW-dependent-type signal peptide-containing protein [Clostridium aestuarii]
MALRKSLLGLALAGAIAVGGAGVGTYAYFTAQATSAENVISTATLGLNESDGDTAGTIVIDGLEQNTLFPDDEVRYSNDFAISNTGSLTLQYRLTKVEAPETSILYYGDGPVNSEEYSCSGLKMRIERKTKAKDENGNFIYEPITDHDSYTNIDAMMNVHLGTLATTASATYRIAYFLPKEADNSFQDQGTQDDLTFTFEATQGNNPWS